MKIFSKLRWPWIILIVMFITGCLEHKDLQEDKGSVIREQAWKIIGPGGGGGVFNLTVSPFNKDFVFSSCDMTGAYVSHNGGRDWRMFCLWTVLSDFEFDYQDSEVVYAATKGYRYSEDRGSGLSLLYRSEDKGKHWEIIYPDISGARKVSHLQNEDFLPSEIFHDAVDGTIDLVKVDPRDGQRIYLGIAPLISYIGNTGQEHADSSEVVISEDYGKSWDVKARFPGKKIFALFLPSERYPDKITVFTDRYCVQIETITGVVTLQSLPADRVIAVDGGGYQGDYRIYLVSSFIQKEGKITGGVFVSDDRGETWTVKTKGLFYEVPDKMLPVFRGGLGVCASNPGVSYISTISPVLLPSGRIGNQYIIFKTESGGNFWKPVIVSSPSRGYLTGNFKGSWMEQSYDPGWGGSPFVLGVSPDNPDVCYAGDNGRCYKTTDGGKNWQQCYSQNREDGSVSSGGLNVTTCYGVHFDPKDKQHFFISYTDIGLFHTFNGGESWVHSIDGIPGPWQNTCYWVVFDPDVKGKVWSVWANAHDLPRDKMFGRDGFERFQGGVAVSYDGGILWEKSNNGLPENAVCTHILLDDDSPADSRFLYVTVFDKGVYKSVDGGKSWKGMNNGLGRNLFAWQIRMNANKRLFVLFTRGKMKGKRIKGAVYYCDEGSERWNRLTLPDGVDAPHDLLTDPEDPGRMYLSCWPRRVNGKDKFGGLYRTNDGGNTWKQVFDGRFRVNSAALDFQHHETIYINTFQNAAFRSEDAGGHWQRIKGYRFKWGQRIFPDIHHPGMLYLTTYGGSVFHGPVQGLSYGDRDIVNMPEEWW